MKIKPTFYLLSLALIWMGLSGCEEKIDLDLDDADLNRVVFEGFITNQPGPYQFRVNRTSDVNNPDGNPLVSGALLVVRDDMGTVDTLREVEPGLYETTKIQGLIEHTYFFDAVVEGQTYRSQSLLPRINSIDTLWIKEETDDFIFGAGTYVVMQAQEQQGVGDFYFFRFYKNDSLYNGEGDAFVSDDRFVDGQLSIFQYPYAVESGDTAVAEVWAITEAAYKYYLAFYQQLNSAGNPFGAPPANLQGNISNGALGWMGAMGVANDTIIIP